jgi:DUF4097 and DUF4098 domain-containing protein YvlB
MNIKKLVFILIGVVLISFGVGLLSLNHYGFNLYNSEGANIDLNGININDGNSSVKIGPKFTVKANDSNNKVFGKGMSRKNLIRKNVNEEKLEDIKGIKTIDVETPFVDVNIIPEEREDIKIHYNGYLEATYIPELKTKKSGDILYIMAKGDNLNSSRVYSTDLKLNIYIPIAFKDNIEIVTSSGDINVSKLKLSNLKLAASSGDIGIHDLSVDNLSIETSSGEQIVKNVKSKNSNFLASSGDIEIYSFIGDTNVTTSSGEINMDYEKFNNSIDAAASSGDITIKLPSNSEFNLNANTSSGEIESSFPITVTGKQKNSLSGKVGNSVNAINITTSSGDISIKH